MILTSYFAKAKDIKKSGRQVVSISRFSPKWLPDVSEIKTLAPSKDLLLSYKINGDEREYAKRYFEETSLIGADKILNNKVLCCYEKPSDFCHRGVLRSMLALENIVSLEMKDSYSLFIIVEEELTDIDELHIKNTLRELNDVPVLVSCSLDLSYLTEGFKNVDFEPFTNNKEDVDVVLYVTKSNALLKDIESSVSSGRLVIRFLEGNRSVMYDYLATR